MSAARKQKKASQYNIMASATPPLPSDDEQINQPTPRKNNSAMRRETHPNTTQRCSKSDGDLQHDVTDSSKVHNPLHQDLIESKVNSTTCNVHMQSNCKDTTSGPLTWNQARDRLKCTLEFWNKCQQKNRDSQSAQTKYRFLCVGHLDIILAMLLCVAFVVLSFTLPVDEDLPESFTLMQRIAAVLFLVSALLSALILNQWAQVRKRDQSIERRRCVTAFLQEMESLSGGAGLSQECNEGGSRADFLSAPCDIIPRKNVEDVYSTYRLNNKSKDSENHGQWHRIPSLLLVKGDYIALKIGDTTPGQCQSANNTADPITLEAGVRLTIDLLGYHPKLPAGKTTIKTDEELLMLANGVQVFELLETPLESFLNKDAHSKFMSAVIFC